MTSPNLVHLRRGLVFSQNPHDAANQVTSEVKDTWKVRNATPVQGVPGLYRHEKSKAITIFEGLSTGRHSNWLLVAVQSQSIREERRINSL